TLLSRRKRSCSRRQRDLWSSDASQHLSTCPEVRPLLCQVGSRREACRSRSSLSGGISTRACSCEQATPISRRRTGIPSIRRCDGEAPTIALNTEDRPRRRLHFVDEAYSE